MPLPPELIAEIERTEIRVKEAYLRRMFGENARVIDPKEGYISVPVVNQLFCLELQGYAADLIDYQFRQKRQEFDKVVQIPNSGIPLSNIGC